MGFATWWRKIRHLGERSGREYRPSSQARDDSNAPQAGLFECPVCHSPMRLRKGLRFSAREIRKRRGGGKRLRIEISREESGEPRMASSRKAMSDKRSETESGRDLDLFPNSTLETRNRT